MRPSASMTRSTGPHYGHSHTALSQHSHYVQIALYACGHVLALVVGGALYFSWQLLADVQEAVLWAWICSMALRDVNQWLIQHIRDELENRSLPSCLLRAAFFPVFVLYDTLADIYRHDSSSNASKTPRYSVDLSTKSSFSWLGPTKSAPARQAAARSAPVTPAIASSKTHLTYFSSTCNLDLLDAAKAEALQPRSASIPLPSGAMETRDKAVAGIGVPVADMAPGSSSHVAAASALPTADGSSSAFQNPLYRLSQSGSPISPRIDSSIMPLLHAQQQTQPTGRQGPQSHEAQPAPEQQQQQQQQQQGPASAPSGSLPSRMSTISTSALPQAHRSSYSLRRHRSGGSRRNAPLHKLGQSISHQLLQCYTWLSLTSAAIYAALRRATSFGSGDKPSSELFKWLIRAIVMYVVWAFFMQVGTRMVSMTALMVVAAVAAAPPAASLVHHASSHIMRTPTFSHLSSDLRLHQPQSVRSWLAMAIRQLRSGLVACDARCRAWLLESLPQIVSCCVVLGALLGAVLLGTITVIQIGHESRTVVVQLNTLLQTDGIQAGTGMWQALGGVRQHVGAVVQSVVPLAADVLSETMASFVDRHNLSYMLKDVELIYYSLPLSMNCTDDQREAFSLEVADASLKFLRLQQEALQLQDQAQNYSLQLKQVMSVWEDQWVATLKQSITHPAPEDALEDPGGMGLGVGMVSNIRTPADSDRLEPEPEPEDADVGGGSSSSSSSDNRGSSSSIATADGGDAVDNTEGNTGSSSISVDSVPSPALGNHAVVPAAAAAPGGTTAAAAACAAESAGNAGALLPEEPLLGAQPTRSVLLEQCGLSPDADPLINGQARHVNQSLNNATTGRPGVENSNDAHDKDFGTQPANLHDNSTDGNNGMQPDNGGGVHKQLLEVKAELVRVSAAGLAAAKAAEAASARLKLAERKLRSCYPQLTQQQASRGGDDDGSDGKGSLTDRVRDLLGKVQRWEFASMFQELRNLLLEGWAAWRAGSEASVKNLLSAHENPLMLFADTLVSLAKKSQGLLVMSITSMFGGTTGMAVDTVTGLFKLGFGILDFIFDFLFFVTVLYYLLVTDTDPIIRLLHVLPIGADNQVKASKAISNAMRGVFMSSIKLVVFHTLFTWLTLKVFNAHFVYLMSLASAIIAILPLLPVWLVAIPAVLELTLLRHQYTSAAVLAFLHFLAQSYADDIIMGEVEPSMPYLTGLGVAGGMYMFSNPLKGVLFGPMILALVGVGYHLHEEFVASEG